MTDRSLKKGLGPGSLVYVGENPDTPVKARIMDYDANKLEELDLKHFNECARFRKTDSVTWIDVDGVHDPEVVSGICEHFDVHVLVQEDIMNSESRPKVEFFDEYMFIVIKMIDFHSVTKHLNVEQFSMVVGRDYIITFQERPGDSFGSIRDRIRTAKGRVRSKDATFLAYLLLDVIVDNYIAVSENYAAQLDALEAQVLKKSNERTLLSILSLRKELIDFKRSIDPLRDALNTIQREVSSDVSRYYRDVYDHLIHESENLAMYREIVVNLLDLHHANLSYRTNSVMKVLTVITTIFVPLTFFVGVYGMNFKNMPELKWHYGYYAAWAFMAAIVAFQLFYFRRKKWL